MVELEVKEILSTQACVFIQENYIKAHVLLYFLHLVPPIMCKGPMGSTV